MPSHMWPTNRAHTGATGVRAVLQTNDGGCLNFNALNANISFFDIWLLRLETGQSPSSAGFSSIVTVLSCGLGL